MVVQSCSNFNINYLSRKSSSKLHLFTQSLCFVEFSQFDNLRVSNEPSPTVNSTLIFNFIFKTFNFLLSFWVSLSSLNLTISGFLTNLLLQSTHHSFSTSFSKPSTFYSVFEFRWVLSVWKSMGFSSTFSYSQLNTPLSSSFLVISFL